ncbi:APC family permease [Entomomonas moraniae]|uniref:APC family permease n=1 Tax=Entomomonas moraniae TaxID=2213226 RepID=A0A3S9XCU7_9GAMM|nr:APC family permease [Entomomonas moraniae]AZS50171.1 APC family permease [Entomomonas moraniae]
MGDTAHLNKNSIGLPALVFFVVAAASPLTGLVGGMPIAILEGNGGGVPGIYILSGVVLLLFSIGFITMSRHVKNSGAFYAYISAGLGNNLGISGLGIAILAYVSIQIAIAAIFGLFTQILFHDYFNIDLPWWLYTLVMLVIVCLLGIERVEIGGKVLGVLMIIELAIALIISFITAYHQAQTASLDFTPFTLGVVFHGNVGIALVFAVAGFIGFEATAIYSEECRNPERNIPLATILAVVIITAFFAFCSWGLIQAYGVKDVQAAVAKSPELFVFNLAQAALGKWSVLAINILLITSLFAATQSFHNNITRYFYYISRDGLFWKRLAVLHATKGTPYFSSICQTITMMVIIAILVVTKQNPLTAIFTWGSAITTMSILLLQTLVSVAVILYFKNRKDLNIAQWKVFYAPLLSAIIMAVFIGIVVVNLDILSGVHSKFIFLIPLFVFGTAVGGFIYSLIIKRLKPNIYNNLDQIINEA